MQRLLFMLILVAALLPVQVLAVALGDELILSRLGDPVEVEIDVLQWEDMDMDRVQISAASQQEYAAFRMTWLPVLENLSFNLLGPNHDGEVRLLVSSREPLNEPFLELLLVLRWPGGSLLREYVLLFDPPGTLIPPPNVSQQPAPAAPIVMTETPASVEPPPAVVVPEPAPPPEPIGVPEPGVLPEPEVAAEPEIEVTPEPEVAAEPAVVPEPQLAAPPAEVPEPQVTTESEPQQQPDVRTQAAIEVETVTVAVAPPPMPQQSGSRRSYQVRIGDSLWNIARQFRPAGVDGNLFQVLVSLHDLNRGAFINGNISLLKANAALQIPDAADIARIDAARAEATFNERWNQGTQRFDAVQVGEALPLFAGEEAEPEPVPEQTFEPVLLAGQELPPAVAVADDLIMVANGPTPLQLETGPDESAVAAPDSVIPAQDSAEVSGALPPLISPSAEALQQVMQVREQQRLALEQQVEAMRIRMQEAQTVAALFSNSLQQAQERRAAREQKYLRNSIVLGALVLALVAGLVLAVVLVVRQARQLRGQRVATVAIAAAAASGAAAVPVRTVKAAAQTKVRQERLEPGFHASQQAAEDAVADKTPPMTAEHPAAPTASLRPGSAEDSDLIDELESLLAGTSPRKP